MLLFLKMGREYETQPRDSIDSSYSNNESPTRGTHLCRTHFLIIGILHRHVGGHTGRGTTEANVPENPDVSQYLQI